MRVKHLQQRLDELAGLLTAEPPEDFPSNLAIMEITGLAKAFSVLAQVRLGEPEPLTNDDEWMLVAFRNTHLHAEFDEAFRRICESDHGDFGRLYARANLFFYRAHDPGQDVGTLVARFRTIMDDIVSDRTCEAILARLREVRVIVEKNAPE